MKGAILRTPLPNIRLIAPDLNRDSIVSKEWLAGQAGRETLRLMGVNERDNHETSLDEEKARVQEFIMGKDQINWMIQADSEIVGSIWVDLEAKDALGAPSVHIMIGDPHVRGMGVGSASMKAVLNYLKEEGYGIIYSRYLVENRASSKMLTKLGFHTDGKPYEDSDGLRWQNASIDME